MKRTNSFRHRCWLWACVSALFLLVLLLSATPSNAGSSNVINQFVYVAGAKADGTGVISAFHVGQDGRLQAMPGSQYALPEYAKFLAASSSGQFLFAVTNSSIVTFLVNPGTGRLSPQSAIPLSSDSNKTGIVVDPVAPLLFLSDDLNPPGSNPEMVGPAEVTAYRIGWKGKLSLIGSTQILTMAGSITDGLSIDARGRLLALNTITSNDDFTTTALSVDSSTGQVTWLNSFWEPLQDYTHELLISPNGTHFYQNLRFLFEAPGGASVAVYSVDDTSGVLAKVQVQTCGCDPNPAFGQISFAFSLAMDPKGRFLFQTTTEGLVVYSIDSTTGLVAPIFRFPISPGPLAVDATGRYVYTASVAGTELTGLKVSSSGTLERIRGTPARVSGADSIRQVVIATVK